MKTKTTQLLDSSEKINSAALIFRALGNKTRIEIMKLINQTEGGKLNVKKIFANLKLEQSIASQHLKILRDANIVKFERDGQKVIYRMNESMCETVLGSIDLLLSYKK